MKARWILTIGLLSAPATAVAGGDGTLVVDPDNCTVGDEGGTEESPFCTLQAALDSDQVAPGARIQLKDAVAPYGGAVASGVNGTEASPIVIEPFPGHLPTLSGELLIEDASYWQVRRLNFVGAGDLGIHADNADNILIADNTLLGFRILVRNGSGSARVEANLVQDAAGTSIGVFDSNAVAVIANVVRGSTCPPEDMGEQFPSIGIGINDSDDARVSGNRVLDFQLAGCSRVSGILLLRAEDAEVDRNFVRGIAGTGEPKMGITVANNADFPSIHHNIVRDISSCGVCLGTGYAGTGRAARVVANTVIDGGVDSVDVSHGGLPDGSDPLIASNILVGATSRNIAVSADHLVVAEHNIYAGAPSVGRCGNTHATLRDWQASPCGPDSNSLAADPQIDAATDESTDDYSPGTLAVDAGFLDEEFVSGLDFVGEAPDIGALEPPVPDRAVVDAGQPDVIEFFLETIESQFDYLSGCEGFLVTIEGAANPGLLTCDWDGGRIDIALDTALVEGQVVHLEYEGDLLAHNTGIGGFIGARMRPFRIEVDNMAPPGSDTSGSSSSTGDASDDDTSADASTDGTPPGDDTGTTTDATSSSSGDTDSASPSLGASGCGCRSSETPPLWLALGLLVLARRRRERV